MSHNCRNLALTCIDFRLGKTYNDFIASLEGESDRVALAGGAKSVVDEDTREAVLKQIEISRRLHGSDTIYLIDHEDCGAYGGKGKLSDAEEEKIHKEMTDKAKQIIKNNFSDMVIISCFANLSGTVVKL